MIGLEHWYRRGLRFTLRHRLLVLLIALASFVLIMAFIRPLVQFVQFPQADARMLFVKVSTPLGTPLEQTEAVATDLQRQIQAVAAADLKTITARIGHQDVNGSDKERGETENEALLTIIFKDLGRPIPIRSGFRYCGSNCRSRPT